MIALAAIGVWFALLGWCHRHPEVFMPARRSPSPERRRSWLWPDPSGTRRRASLERLRHRRYVMQRLGRA